MLLLSSRRKQHYNTDLIDSHYISQALLGYEYTHVYRKWYSGKQHNEINVEKKEGQK